MNGHKTSKSGSALLLTLLVVSLLLVIVLSFTVYVRLELRSIGNQQNLMLARHNAKLAMNLALAQLQKAAGPDQRVTARAEILGGTVQPLNRFITGVWDAENPSDAPTWLISMPQGQSFDPTISPAPATSIPLIDTGVLGPSLDNDDRILAGLNVIPGTSGNGNYAWYISDEGVKASLSLNDPYSGSTDIQTLTQTELKRLRYAVPHRNAQEFAFSTPTDFEDASLNALSERVLNLGQYPFSSGLTDPRADGGIHHYTHRAMGLLTQPITGGVKKDLSLAPSLLGVGFEEFMDFTSYLVEPSAAHPVIKSSTDLRRAHRITPPTNLNPADGDIVHSVTPIITDFGLQFSPRRESKDDGRASLMMAIMLELWNPYTTALEEDDLILEISGFQPFDMILRDISDTVVWSDTFDPNAVFGNVVSLRLQRSQFHATKYLDENAYDTKLHAPGRLLYWAGPVQAQPSIASFATYQSDQARLKGTISPPIIFPVGAGAVSAYTVGYEMDPTTLTVRLRRAPENGGQILVEHKNLEYESVDTLDHGDLGGWTLRWLTYRFRIIERGTNFTVDKSAWLKNIDKRTPTPSFGDDITKNTHTQAEDANSYDPSDTNLKNTLSFTKQDFKKYYFGRTLSNSPWSRDYRRDLPLFELPRQPLISVGQLQHLYIHGMPPYSIGNPWGGSTWNQLFDDYFLSGIQLNISEPDFSSTSKPQLPHPRLELAEPQDLGLSTFDNSTFPSLAENAALVLQVKGHFNLNSVSAKAWKAILGGAMFHHLDHMERDTNLHDANHTNAVVQSNNNYPAGFTRFPQSIQELFQVDLTLFDPSFDPQVLHMKPGITFLYDRSGFADAESDYNTADDSKLTRMAEEIADAIAQRTQTVGHPYLSMNEFLTEVYQNGNTLLEHVIETVGLRRVEAPSGTVMPEERTPSWLSQADVISALAPFLSTRSDTFTIRAYGDIAGVNGTLASRAWCEAVVQRTIKPVEPGLSLNDMADPLTSVFGRHFKIVSFKWLTESEI